MIYSRITGTGSYLPENIVTNAKLASTLETSDEWIKTRTGIRQRHIAADDETSASMGAIAAQRALSAANISEDSIDLIIVATCTPDAFFPATACLIQKALSIEKPIIAFDLSAACTGFIYALSVADQFIRNNAVSNALIIGTETMSRTVDWMDRGTCVLFGDGAGAVVLSASDTPGVHKTHLHAQGKNGDILSLANAQLLKEAPEFMHMEGREVFKHAVTEMGNLVNETLAGFESLSIDWLVPHQANLRIIQAIAKKLDLPQEKVIITVDEQANTSGASIPLALDEACRDGRIQPGHTCLLEAFGGGMTWGSALVTL